MQELQSLLVPFVARTSISFGEKRNILCIFLFGNCDILTLELSVVKEVASIQKSLWDAALNGNMIWILQTDYCFMQVSKFRNGVWIPIKVSWIYGANPSYFLTDSLTNTEKIFKNSWTVNSLSER